MGGHLPDLLVGVLADVLRRVDGEQLVGVHGHQNGARVRLRAKRDQELAASAWEALTLESSQALPCPIPLEGTALTLESHGPGVRTQPPEALRVGPSDSRWVWVGVGAQGGLAKGGKEGGEKEAPCASVSLNFTCKTGVV